MSILKFLGLSDPAGAAGRSTPETDTVRKITEALDRLDPELARFIAAFAYLLSRVASADLNISPEETRVMERLVIDRAGLTEAQAILVVQMAKTQNLLFGGVENFLVTREFGRIATHEQKVALLDCLFAVSSTDESIVSAEDTEVRKIASELYLSHQEFVDVKSRYRRYLEVLKKRAGSPD